ncbi:MAG: hypothetical protein H6974_09590 [Gammaproteobacteria bacterium]|nr:hypothetical protein [Gammaproteobacteria bacterium]
MAYDRNGFLFLGRMNVRYHENRELHYERFINWTALASVLLSSAAFVALGPLLPDAWQPGKEAITAIATLLVTTLNGAMLAFGMFNKFTLHADLKRQWMAFLARLERTDDSHLGEIEQAFHEMNSREPAADDKLLKEIHKKTQEALDWQ